MRRITRRRFLQYAGAGLASLAAGDRFAGMPAAQEQIIPIGAVYPLTAAVPRIGAAIRTAVDLAAEVVNNPYPNLSLPLARDAGLPRLGGRKVRIIWADTRGDSAIARVEAERLIERGRVVALIGSYQNAATASASLVAEARGIPFLNPESTSPKLTERGLRWFFRTGPHDATLTRLFFQMMEDLKRRGYQISRVAVVAEDSEVGATAAGVAQGFADTYSYALVARELYTSPPGGLTAELARIRAVDPDVVIGANNVLDAILIVRTLREMRWFPQGFMVHEGFSAGRDFLWAAREDGNYFLPRALWAQGIRHRKPLVGRVGDLYKARFGVDMDDVSARTFTGVLCLADAINRAGALSAAAIGRALRETHIPASQLIMPWEGIEFDEMGQNRHAGGVVTQILGGEYKVVWPFELAEAPLVWPAPSWDKR